MKKYSGYLRSVEKSNERIGKRLQFVLATAGKTVPDLQRDLGEKDPSYLYRLVKGQQNPTVDVLERILLACGTNLGAFFAPWAMPAPEEDIEAENERAMLAFQQLLKDPVSRPGAISAVMMFASPQPQRRKSARPKK